MKNALRALAFLVMLLPGAAWSQCNSSTPLPVNSVLGRLGTIPGPCQAIPFNVLGIPIIGNAFVNFTGPTTPIKTYTLPNANDTISTLAAVQSFTAAKTFADLTLILAGSSSGTTTLKASAAASGVLTLPAVTDTLAGLTATQTLTNKTLTAPVISSIVNTGTLTLPTSTDTLVGRATADTLTNKSIVATQLTGALQAAQEPAHTGDCTNSAGSLALNCLQTNGVSFTATATAAAGQLPGTATNDNAAAGKVGEYVQATATSTAITTATQTNITSISLTAGDWDITGAISFVPTGTTNIVDMIASISTTSATLDQATFNSTRQTYGSGGVVPTASFNNIVNVGPRRLSLSATTTVFLVGWADFTASTLTTAGGIRARRVR
jgi:hypothetical protein